MLQSFTAGRTGTFIRNLKSPSASLTKITNHYRPLQHHNINTITTTLTTSIHTHHTQHKPLAPTTPVMADDTSYSTFLSKANEDPNSGARPDTHSESTSQARSRYDPTLSASSPDSAIPASLRDLPDTPYVSDTDSDWQPVFFNYAADTLPTLEQFKQVLRASKGFGEQGGEDQSVEELSVREFDPRGQYEEVVERVRQAGEEVGKGKRGKLEGGDKGVKVFRVEVTRTRIEYYVLTVGERKLVGVVAKAVES